MKSSRNGKRAVTLAAVLDSIVSFLPIIVFKYFADKLIFFRVVKEQMGSARSQETLDSVGLQTPSEIGTSVHERATTEGNYFESETHKRVAVRF